ncbi:BRO family protein [Nitrospirillum iridis]|uniref:Prophage antirepressor-like protein n=1 Tax=Nitrospirillum iridis TaxID=765888 RepID=A0A7X0AWL1_9PROT|nr:BRO family protein [Nitrospirillum iridis]MBB6251405.1 prophage antirepressor-like protein [Nitrospirillum iridis]
MTAVIPFSFEGANVRVLDREGAPWWVLSDVCRVLEIGNTSDASRRLDPDERDTLDNIEGIARAQVQQLTVINESGLYSLILTSRKPAAKRFKKWVTAEVLPSLRRTGRYEMGQAARPLPRIVLTDEDYRKRLMVVTYLRVHGPLAAQRYWRDIGLATASPPPEIPSAPGASALNMAEWWRGMADGGMTASEIGAASGVNPRVVQYSLRMVERLIDPAKRALEEGKINPYQARHMSAGNEEQQAAILALIQSGVALTGDQIATYFRVPADEGAAGGTP